MTAQVIRSFKHLRQPADDRSQRQWLENELLSLQNTLNDIVAAIKQLQGKVSGL